MPIVRLSSLGEFRRSCFDANRYIRPAGPIYIGVSRSTSRRQFIFRMPDGWHLSAGCWTGMLSEVEAHLRSRCWYRPTLQAKLALLAALQSKANRLDAAERKRQAIEDRRLFARLKRTPSRQLITIPITDPKLSNRALRRRIAKFADRMRAEGRAVVDRVMAYNARSAAKAKRTVAKRATLGAAYGMGSVKVKRSRAARKAR